MYKNDPSSLPNSVKQDWKEKAEDTNIGQKNRINALLDGESVEDVMGLNKNLNRVKLYKQPLKVARDDTYDDGLEQAMTDADDFIADGKSSDSSTEKLNLQNFQTQFGDIYNIILQIGVGLAVIVGVILGIKFILSSVEGKPEVKKMLITYVVSCAVIFGSFGIWKIVVTILQTV